MSGVEPLGPLVEVTWSDSAGRSDWHSPDDARRILGTCQTSKLGLVWHVFEKPIQRNIGELILLMAEQGQ